MSQKKKKKPPRASACLSSFLGRAEGAFFCLGHARVARPQVAFPLLRVGPGKLDSKTMVLLLLVIGLHPGAGWLGWSPGIDVNGFLSLVRSA